MLRGPINWGDKPHRVEDAVDKMMGRLGWYGTTDYPTAKRGRVSIDMEMEDWNRDEPGESGIARATLVLIIVLNNSFLKCCFTISTAST